MDTTTVEPVMFDFGEGKNRELKFTLSSVRQFSKNYGKTLFRVRLTGPNELQPEMAMDHSCMTFVVQAALLHEEPSLGFNATEDLLEAYISSGGDVFKIAAALSMAFNASGLFGIRKSTEEISKELRAAERLESGKSPNAKRGRALN